MRLANNLREEIFCMKKLSNPLLAAFLLIEIIVAISFVSQLEKYPQFWVVICGFAVMAGVTAYFFIKNIVNYFAVQKSARDTQLEYYMHEFLEFKNDYLKMYTALKDSINELTKNNVKSAEEFREASTEAYLKLTEEINNNSTQQFAMLTNSFSEQSDKICVKTDETVKLLGSTVHNEMDGVLTSIKTLLNEFDEQINHTKSLMEQVISHVKDALDHQIATVETRTSNIQNSISETFNDGMENMNSSLTLMQTVFDRKLIDIHAEYEKMLTDVKSELTRHTQDVSGYVSENTRILSENLDNYSQNVSENLQHIWSKNVDALETSCEVFLIKTSKMLANRNLELMNQHTDYSHERIKEISDEYDRIMDAHIVNLKNEIQEYISEFTKVNHAAFEQNAENVEKLVGSEDKFIEELTSNNQQLNSVIANGFNQYRDAVIKMFSELESKLKQNIEDGMNVSKEHISGISEHNKAVINELAENLKQYSDSFVDKSAEAIANVQQDNNLKLQEMCESYADFSRDSRIFAQSCNENNLKTNDSIKLLIEQNQNFLVNLQWVSNNSVEEIDKVLNGYVDNMSQKLEALNVVNSNRYNDAMENYRDSFVKINADALANVQKDNIDAISNAYHGLAELADNIKKTDGYMKHLGEKLDSILNDTKKIIAEGNETASENQKDFNEDFDININKMKGIFIEKLSEYNDAFAQLDKKISSVLNEVQKNTESYNSTLKSITDSQNAMNSLTSKDIHLLEKLVRG